MQQNKERVTLSLFTNLLGDKRFKPILIGKIKKTKNELELIYGDEILYYSQKSLGRIRYLERYFDLIQ